MMTSEPASTFGFGIRSIGRYAGVAVCLLVVFVGASASAVDSERRDGPDESDYRLLAYQHPEAAELLVRAESALSAGRLEDGANLLQQTVNIELRNALVWRRYCEVLALQGKQNEAIDACHRALSSGANPAGLRATVGALLHGTTRPSTERLAEALLYVNALRRSARSQVHSYSAECDLAETLGDWPAYALAASKLSELFPNHPETRRAAAVLQARKSAWYVPFGWSLIAFVLFGTLAHACYARYAASRRRSSPQVAPRLAILGLCLLACAGLPTIARAEPSQTKPKQLSSFEIDDSNPEASVPTDQQKNRDPLQFGYFIMDLSDRGELAVKSGDHATAIRYYRALAKAVPDRATAFSKLCQTYAAMNDRQHALASCRGAALLEGVKVEDYLRLADLVLSGPDPIAKAELTELGEIAAHLRKEQPESIAADHIDCRVGVRLRDLSRLRLCTEHLAKVAPTNPETISFQWAFAVARGDLGAAAQHLQAARLAKVPMDQILKMEETTRASQPWLRLVENRWVLVSIPVALLGALAVWLLARRSRLPRRQVA